MKHYDHTYDKDGNLIQVGMSAVSHGETWVVGYAWKGLVRLDKKGASMMFGRNRLFLVHVIGFRVPLIY